MRKEEPGLFILGEPRIVLTEDDLTRFAQRLAEKGLTPKEIIERIKNAIRHDMDLIERIYSVVKRELKGEIEKVEWIEISEEEEEEY